jgi:hypothetical protein
MRDLPSDNLTDAGSAEHHYKPGFVEDASASDLAKTANLVRALYCDCASVNAPMALTRKLAEIDSRLVSGETVQVLEMLERAGFLLVKLQDYGDEDGTGLVHASLKQLVENMNAALPPRSITLEYKILMESGKYVLRDVNFSREIVAFSASDYVHDELWALADKLADLNPMVRASRVFEVILMLERTGFVLTTEGDPPKRADEDRTGMVHASLNQLVEAMNAELLPRGITLEYEILMESGKYVLRDVKFFKRIEPASEAHGPEHSPRNLGGAGSSVEC